MSAAFVRFTVFRFKTQIDNFMGFFLFLFGWLVDLFGCFCLVNVCVFLSAKLMLGFVSYHH